MTAELGVLVLLRKSVGASQDLHASVVQTVKTVAIMKEKYRFSMPKVRLSIGYS